jgi:cell wall assembly regulator SMI1
MEDVKEMKKQKYGQMRGYYQKHSGKETFSQNLYEQLKFDFETIEKLDNFFNRLSQDFPLLAKISESVGTLKKERQNGQAIEWMQLWIPLISKAKVSGNCYFINLLKMEDSSHE